MNWHFAKEYVILFMKRRTYCLYRGSRPNYCCIRCPEKGVLNKRIGPAVEKAMEERSTIMLDEPGQEPYCHLFMRKVKNVNIREVIAPIIAEGDPIRAVLISKEPDVKFRVGIKPRKSRLLLLNNGRIKRWINHLLL